MTDATTPVVYMIRHGQTDWNAKGRLQGQTEVPMNNIGKTQVLCNARKLARLPGDLRRFDYVSSPISRARETMEIIRSRLGFSKQNYHTDDRLKELNYGEFSKHTWEELRRTRPQEVMQRFDKSWTYVMPKGECYAMLSKRVLNWFYSVERNTIISAHAGVSRVLQAHFAKCPQNNVAFLEAPQDRILVIHDDEISWL